MDGGVSLQRWGLYAIILKKQSRIGHERSSSLRVWRKANYHIIITFGSFSNIWVIYCREISNCLYSPMPSFLAFLPKLIQSFLNQVMRVSRSNESLQIKASNRKLKEVDHFKYLGSLLTGDGYCTREIKMKIVIAKEAFNRKISLLTSKLNIQLRKKLVRCLEH